MVDVVAVDPLDPAQHELFTAWVGVHEAAARAAYERWHTAWSARELRVQFSRQDDERQLAWAGVLDGEVVGHAQLTLPVHDNTHRAELTVMVRPDRRRCGVGSALLATLERAARADGRTVTGTESDVADGRDDPAVGFAARHGYAPELTELRSDLPLPVPGDVLAALQAETRRHAAGYDVLTSWDGVPDEWLADRAELSRRMSTDVPLGGVDWAEERWDTARVRRTFEVDAEQGRRVVESVARHEASGRLVAFTTLVVPEHTPTLAYQWDTLVLPEHRGHRLGLLVKAANLRALLAGLPDVCRVATWNAAENAPMLGVNRALGFRQVGRTTEWQKQLR